MYSPGAYSTEENCTAIMNTYLTSTETSQENRDAFQHVSDLLPQLCGDPLPQSDDNDDNTHEQ